MEALRRNKQLKKQIIALGKAAKQARKELN